jgi:hypothetical protein
MGRGRRCWGTDELTRLDLRIPQLRYAAAKRCHQGERWVRFPPRGDHPACEAELTLTRCRFGGYRPWFYCPSCGRRVLVLYWLPEAWHPGCRRCLRLTYRSQRVSRNWMAYGQQQVVRLVRRYLPTWEYADQFPAKPSRIRWKTWERLCAKVEAWEQRLNADFLTVAYRRFGKYL